MGYRWTTAVIALALGGVAYPSMAATTAAKAPAQKAAARKAPSAKAPSTKATVTKTSASKSTASGKALGKKSAKSAARKKAPAKAPDPAAIPSEEVIRITDWVIASGDNHKMPFMVIDKIAAEVFIHDAEGMLVASTPALVGITPGDESAPGVGDRELSDIPPEDRTTPAGRFVANFGRASGSRNVLWVDYPTSISLHAVVTTKKKERRLQRLKSPTPEDNRITFGCINVPTAFYTKVVRPLFKGRSGVVYILPETKSLNEVFLAYQPVIAPALPLNSAPNPDSVALR